MLKEGIGGDSLNRQIKKNITEVERILQNIKNYDAEQFSIQLLHWVRELNYFYSKLVPQQSNDPSQTFYHINPPSNRPNEGQVGYFNLRRGYPKELYDGHWCYILRDFKTKYLIVPLTSVKKNTMKDKYEVEIVIANFENDLSSRLQVTDLRFIDAQRINEREAVYDTETPREKIVEEVMEILSIQRIESVLK